jgi:hypothetical protein
MTKATLVLIMSAMALMTAGCPTGMAGAPTTQSAAAQRDYDRLSGTWQLTRGVVNGKPVAPKGGAKYSTDHRSQHIPISKGERRWDASTGNFYCKSGDET